MSRALATRLRSTCCLARQSSWLYCIAIQLSGERPRHFDGRNAISGLTPLAPVSTPQRVQTEPRDVHVLDDLGRIEGSQLHSQPLRMLRLASGQGTRLVEPPQSLVPERLDHDSSVPCCASRNKRFAPFDDCGHQ